jgi:hypothetical protein
MSDTWAELLDERRDWLRVTTIVRPDGGFDVALILDGTYMHQEDAVASGQMLAADVRTIVGANR